MTNLNFKKVYVVDKLGASMDRIKSDIERSVEQSSRLKYLSTPSVDYHFRISTKRNPYTMIFKTQTYVSEVYGEIVGEDIQLTFRLSNFFFGVFIIYGICSAIMIFDLMNRNDVVAGLTLLGFSIGIFVVLYVRLTYELKYLYNEVTKIVELKPAGNTK